MSRAELSMGLAGLTTAYKGSPGFTRTYQTGFRHAYQWLAGFSPAWQSWVGLTRASPNLDRALQGLPSRVYKNLARAEQGSARLIKA
eukprot:1607799-Pyramimonas_sp.AAC.1